MVRYHQKKLADSRGLSERIIRVIAKKTLSAPTFCVVAFLLFMYAGRRPDLLNMTQEVSDGPIISSEVPTNPKNLQLSSDPESTTDDDDVRIVQDDTRAKSSPKSPAKARKRPDPINLQREFEMRQAQPIQPYTPSLAEISAFKASVGDVCRAHNKHGKQGYRFAPLVDKHAIKGWVQSTTPHVRIAQEYAHVNASNVTALTAELLAKFPSQKFMIKAAHTSGCIASVSMETNTIKCLKPPCFQGRRETPKINGTKSIVSRLQDVCQAFLSKDYSAQHGEKQYANIPPRCVLEEQLEFSVSATLYDYKIHTFHGRPTVILIHGNRFGPSKRKGLPSLTRNARTPYDWKEVPIPLYGKDTERISDEQLGPRPDFLDDMLRDTQTLVQHAAELIGGFPYVRVDFFVYQRAEPIANNNDGANGSVTSKISPPSSSVEVAFAELTFTHANCGELFDKNHPWANQFYGFIGQHPEYNISPSSILDLLEEEQNNDKHEGK